MSVYACSLFTSGTALMLPSIVSVTHVSDQPVRSEVVWCAGIMNSRPARLRPALPQDWVQAVDERAADSGTPTSAPTPFLPDPVAATAAPTSVAPTPTSAAADDHNVSVGAAPRQLGSDQALLPPEQAGISNRDNMHDASQAGLPTHPNSMAGNSGTSTARQQVSEPNTAQAAPPAAAVEEMQRRGDTVPESTAHKSAAMLSLEAMIPPPFETGSPTGSPTFPASTQPAPHAVSDTRPHSAFQNAGALNFVDTVHRNQAGGGLPDPALQAEDNNGIMVGRATRPPQAPAPPLGGDTSYDPSPSFRRLASTEVQRRIEQTAVDVQQAVNERDGTQPYGRGRADIAEGVPNDALARATGTLRALVAGRSEEAEFLSRGLPTQSGESSTDLCVCPGWFSSAPPRQLLSLFMLSTIRTLACVNLVTV